MNILKALTEKVMDMFLTKSTLDSLGIVPASSGKMSAAQKRWAQMYKSDGGLCLGSAIASEVARLVTLEMKSEIDGSKRAEYLNAQYARLLKKLRRITEYACALGGVVLKPYVQGDSIEVACIRAGDFIPIRFDSCDEVTGAAFLDRKVSGSKYYTRVEHHEIADGGCTIKNYAFVSESESELGRRIPLKAVDGWEAIEPVTKISGLKKPLFAYFKMPMANTVDSLSPLGMSVYAKCENLIDDANAQYERLKWEFSSGERALYVHDTAFKTDSQGRKILPDKRLYRLIAGEDLFEEWSPEIREASYIHGLNEILRKIEFNSSLAYGTLSNVQETDKTAEEIRDSKQRSYSQIADIQSSLSSALLSLVEAMDTLADLYELAPSGQYSVSFTYDDSIVADRKTEFSERCELVTLGVMSPWEMRMWYFGENEKTARESILKLNPDLSGGENKKSAVGKPR